MRQLIQDVAFIVDAINKVINLRISRKVLLLVDKVNALSLFGDLLTVDFHPLEDSLLKCQGHNTENTSSKPYQGTSFNILTKFSVFIFEFFAIKQQRSINMTKNV